MNMNYLFAEIPLQAAFNSLSEGLVILDSNSKVLFTNTSALTICDITAENCIANCSDLESSTFINTLNGEHLTNHQLVLNDKRWSETKTLSLNAHPIYKEEKIIGMILTFRDITSKIKKEEALIRERAFYHQILNTIPAFISFKDLSGSTTFKNEQHDHSFYETTIFDEYDQHIIRNQRRLDFEEEVVNPETQKKHHFQSTRMPMINLQGVVYGISSITYDVTDEWVRKQNLEDERSKIATASKLAALGVMAAEIGHEINNPLAIIRTCSWIIRKTIETGDFEMGKMKLDEIDQTVQRIDEIVKSLRNLAHDSSRETLKPYVIRDILKDVQSICGTRFNPRGIEFRLDKTNPLMDITIKCLRVQLSEVFINLLNNAVDAVENIPHAWIKMDILEKDGQIIFRVTDKGEGISEEIEARIFTPFFSTKEMGKGTGLGLSISKTIMKRQAGDLILNREISANCFEVSLPFDK